MNGASLGVSAAHIDKLARKIVKGKTIRLTHVDATFQGSETRDLKLEKCGPVQSESRRDVTRMSLDVTKCHRFDIAWSVHKLMVWNGLDLESQPNSPHFREKCDILRHFVTRRPSTRAQDRPSTGSFSTAVRATLTAEGGCATSAAYWATCPERRRGMQHR